MIRIYKTLFLITAMVISTIVFAQAPPPPNGDGSDPVTGGNSTVPPSGGGAPIGSGIGLLVLMGAAYGGKKYYQFRKTLQEE